MYDPTVRRALLETLGRWKRLPCGDLLDMLPPAQRLRFRPEALADLEAEGLVARRSSGDEAVITITDDGARWLAASPPA